MGGTEERLRLLSVGESGEKELLRVGGTEESLSLLSVGECVEKELLRAGEK